MHITATHIKYFRICKRKLWLFSNGINMEQTSDTVYDGKLLQDTSYPQRNEKHTELPVTFTYSGLKLYGIIDFYDARKKVIHETKRSNKIEQAHIWQVKFYLWLLKLNGVEDVTAIIEYPVLRETSEVTLTDMDILELEKVLSGIRKVLESDQCPPVIHSKICKSCSYYELCYVAEESE